MARDHFKHVMFTPNFVKDTRDSMNQYSAERKIENIFNAFLKPFKAILRLRVPKESKNS